MTEGNRQQETGHRLQVIGNSLVLLVSLLLALALPVLGGQIKDENQILNASLDLANGALRAEVAAGTPAPSNQFLDNDQIFNLLFDSLNSALRIECIAGCGGAGSSTFQVNGVNTASQTLINYENGSGITVSSPSAGNIQFSFTGTLPATQSAASHQWLNSYNASTGAFTATQPAFSDLSGTLADLQLPADAAKFSGTLTVGDCVKVASAATFTDAGAPCGSGGAGFTGWTQNGTTGAILGQPASGQDATTLTILGSTAGSPIQDIFDICSNNAGVCGTKYFWIGANGSLGFYANALSLGSANQPTASYDQKYGGIGAAAYDQLLSPSLPTPAAPVPTHQAGGSLTAQTYSFKVSYNAGGTQQYTTAVSPAGSVTAVANDEIIVPNPPALAGATGWSLYEEDPGHGVWVIQGTYTTFSSVTLTSINYANVVTPPTANSTGAQFSTYISAAAGMNGVACISATVPGYDCAAGTQVLTQATGVELNPTATQLIKNSSGGETDIKSSGGSEIAYFGYGGTTVTHLASVVSEASVIVDNLGGSSQLVLTSDKDRISSGFGTENTDLHGSIAISAATSASFTFPQAYNSAPDCVLTPTSNPGTATWWVTATNTAVTANLSASGTITFNYICIGAPN